MFNQLLSALKQLWSNRPKRYFLLFALLTLPIVWYNTDWIWYRAGVVLLLATFLVYRETRISWKEQISSRIDPAFPYLLSLYALQMRDDRVASLVETVRWMVAGFLFFSVWDWGSAAPLGFLIWERLLLWLFFLVGQFLIHLYEVEQPLLSDRFEGGPLLLFRSSQPVGQSPAGFTKSVVQSTGNYIKKNPVKVGTGIFAGTVFLGKVVLEHQFAADLIEKRGVQDRATVDHRSKVALFEAKSLSDLRIVEGQKLSEFELSKLNRQIELVDKQSALVEKQLQLKKVGGASEQLDLGG